MAQDNQGWQQFSPGDQVGVYRLVRQIGEGGMGFIWEVEHIGLGRRCALKIMRQDQVSEGNMVRFLREARISAQLDHPHAVAVYDSGVHEGVPYIVMEYLEGETLADRLEREGQLEPWEIVSLGLAMADVLAKAHRIGILHRDIKPSNIMLVQGSAGELHPKLLDFGISLLRDPWPESLQRRITDSRVLLGTPHYMAPERCRDFREASPATDVYALGVVLYECAAGCPPVDSDSFWEVIDRTIRGDIPHLTELRRDLPRRFCEVIHRCIAVSLSERFGSMMEVGGALLPHGRADVSEKWRVRFVGRQSEPYLRYRPARQTWRPRVTRGFRVRSRVWTPLALAATLLLGIGLWPVQPTHEIESAPVLPAAADAGAQELRMGYVGALGAFDFYESIAAPVSDARRALVQTLSERDSEGVYRSELIEVLRGAESRSPVIRVRQGLAFPPHPCFPEGREVLPEDVAYSISLAQDQGWATLPLAEGQGAGEGLKVGRADASLTLELTQPLEDLHQELAQVYLVPQEAQECEALGRWPVGTGAYRLERAPTSEGAVMVPNAGSSRTAHVDRLIWSGRTSALDGISDVGAGRLDALLLYPRDEGFSSLFQVTEQGRIELVDSLELPGVQVGAEVREAYALRVVMQMPRTGPYAAPALRRLLHGALDLEALASVSRHGVTQPWSRFLVPGVQGYDPGAAFERTDEDIARREILRRQRSGAQALPRLLIGVTATSAEHGRELVRQLAGMSVEAEIRVLALSEIAQARVERPDMAFMLGQQWRPRAAELRVLTFTDEGSHYATSLDDVPTRDRDDFYRRWERELMQRLPYMPIAVNERVVPYRVVVYGERVEGVFDPVTGRRRNDVGHWVQSLRIRDAS